MPSSAARVIRALIFKGLKSNFYIEISVKFITSVSLMSVQRNLSVLTLYEAP